MFPRCSMDIFIFTQFHVINLTSLYSSLKAKCIWTYNSKFLAYIANISWNNCWFERIYWLENEIYPWCTLHTLLVKFWFMVLSPFLYVRWHLPIAMYTICGYLCYFTSYSQYNLIYVQKIIPTVCWICHFCINGQPTQERSWNHEAYLLFPVHLDGTLLDNAKTMKAKKEFFSTSDVLQIFRQVIRSLELLMEFFFR